ncbi:Protein of unknown function [Pyronema omphalodes CBS 100304]|uniref:Uncharacterized protein n=1 Tax=Pyronema omphalodes (strain CBS 100304) TaxID=1076935 RepID=U4LC34_PYROM|nr:Protein of unknown function [Pyronema omphalodes CBS 100304]
MSNSSNNQLPTAIRGGTGVTPTPANSYTNPDSKFASNGLSGMFESKSEGKNDSWMNTKPRVGGTNTNGVVNSGDSILGKIAERVKDTLGTSK